MKRIPRLLPLVAVAIVGVLAINLLAGARSLPSMLSGARAWAEGLAEGAEAAPDANATPPAGADAATKAAICAPTEAELAGDAGLSVAELRMLESLRARRTELDQREEGFDTQMQLLTAAEDKIDAKVANMQDLVAEMKELLGMADEAKEAENARLVKVYETMNPRQAAPQLAAMADGVRLPIMAKMNERKLAAVLQAMTPIQAKEVTEKLAQRTADLYALDQARNAIAAASPQAGATAAGASARPTQTAAAPPAAAPTAAGATPARPASRPAASTPAPAAGGTAQAPG